MATSATDPISTKIAQLLDDRVEEPCLYDSIDPDAIDQLIESVSDDTDLRVEFTVDGYRVVIDSGIVSLQDR